jgi:hypothetical protein
MSALGQSLDRLCRQRLCLLQGGAGDVEEHSVHRVTSPETPPYLAEVGSGLGGVAPHAFRLPLVGVLEGDSIRLTVQPATIDFSDLMAGHLIWVVQPLGGLWPEMIDSPVLFQKAHPIFERVIRLHPVLMVKQDGNLMVARGTFARDGTSPDGTARDDLDHDEGVQSRLPAAPARTEGEAVVEAEAGGWIMRAAERGRPWLWPASFSILRAAAR